MLFAKWIHIKRGNTEEDGPHEEDPEKYLWIKCDSLHQSVDKEQNDADSHVRHACRR